MEIRVLCVGDVVGRPGRQVLSECLGRLIREYEIDCTIVNAENAAGGSGLTPVIYDKLHKYGANLITMGDHVFRKRDILTVLQKETDIVRPANLSAAAIGREWAIYETGKGPKVAVITLLGRMYMSFPSDNPFQAVERVLEKVRREAQIVVVEMHAEATSEKVAMGWLLDGRVSVVFGTHTHVATADERILPGGTAYITDVGMTGPHESVLGRTTERVLRTLTTQMPQVFSIATGDLRLNGLVVTVDGETGRAKAVERICVQSTSEPGPAYDSDDGGRNG